MAYDTRYRTGSSFFGGSLPTAVKGLIVANVAIYLLDLVLSLIRGAHALSFLALVPYEVLHHLAVWQLVTYMFVHSTDVFHILFNMLGLWMFGSSIEQTWGTRRFLNYYFLCGIGAGICTVIWNTAIGRPLTPTLGASGAIFGLLLAFGMLFPDQEILLFFLFPVKAKYAVMIFGAVELISLMQMSSGISNIAHLGGMLFGYLYIRSQFTRRKRVKVGPGFSLDLSRRWKEYKLQRAKKKFQVYMKKHGSGRPQ